MKEQKQNEKIKSKDDENAGNRRRKKKRETIENRIEYQFEIKSAFNFL